jgi:hypothetical protein
MDSDRWLNGMTLQDFDPGTATGDPMTDPAGAKCKGCLKITRRFRNYESRTFMDENATLISLQIKTDGSVEGVGV